MNTIKAFLKQVYGIIFFTIFRIAPIKKDKIVFSCFSGKRFGDSPKYISIYLLEKYPEVKQVWLYKETFSDLPQNITAVKWGSISSIYHLSTASVWVDSHTKPSWIQKRKKQFYIETWHGGLGVKKIEKDAGDKIPKHDIKRIKHNSSMIDLLLSNSDWTTKVFRNSFWYNGPIKKTGFPKTDYLLNNLGTMTKKVHDFYGINENEKILLYAPTMRNEPVDKDIFLFDTKKVLSALNKKTGTKWKIILRFHPVNQKLANNFAFNENVLNGNLYQDMQDLIGGCDLYLSDYSGSLFDAAIVQKPTFIFAKDIKRYIDERGFYMDIYTLPFPIAENEDVLIENIKKFSRKTYLKNISEYFNKVGLYEPGNSTQIVANIIMKHMEIKK